ncbi:MAG: spore cortex biosynthesis protein YabQ [Clostridia bacterium]|nr:spore cortex biosynthesis protein YabQ [Clostridia bacterium]
MTLSEETTVFLIFVVMGMVFSVIFDIFRAIRKVKKLKNKTIYFQDIIYFLIVGSILLVIIINYMNTELRIYLILAIILGVIIYISTVGNMVMNLIVKFIKISGKIIEFLFLPITLYIGIFEKQIVILKKYVIKCCKKIKDMINLNHIKKKFEILRTKEDKINGKSGKQQTS